jgi:serine/threonine protein kinase/Tfp pilus assembly protein PilF
MSVAALNELNMAEPIPSEQSIFLAAVEKPTAVERAAYLDQACASSPELRSEVEALLAAHERLPAAHTSAAADLNSTSTFTSLGTIIGRYKILEPIGEGGYGTVFMAEQTSPVHRKVALKIIKAGMDTRQVIARFEAERQALALMDHPNIAKVFDAGVTETGRPYFVMELVKGVPITKYCDEHRLTPRDRLELFMPVCHAVQHAHQKGIIHRDLKPTNVLVALYDGKPVPKVIDFGVAKATGQQLTERTMFTGFGDVIGTPEYMSPEQAELNQLDIDTRSDIYSLGVLLYELLTGTTPIEHKRVKQAALLEVLRVIREEEPPKPSTRLSTAEGLASIAANRGVEPKKLSGLMHGELDWIVMKALEKDRSRRYETANGFAMDVQRYLADEPVLACPPSVGYRLRKFARRNKAALAFTGLVLLIILTLTGGIAWNVRDRAARAAERANHLERAIERAALLQREGKRGEALAALERAQLLAGEAEAAPPLARRIDSLRQLLDAEERDEAFVSQFSRFRDEVRTEVDVEKSTFRNRTLPKLRETLEQYGIAIGLTSRAATVTHIQKRPARIQTVVLAALDECLDLVPREDADTREWLIDVLQKADGDPWRNKVRRVWKQPAMLEALAKDIDVRQQPPSFLLLVVKALPITSPSSLDLARRVQFAYPGDFWANHELGRILWCTTKPAEAVRYYTAALSLRPDNPGVLLNRANALRDAKELHAAIADLQRAIIVSPRYGMAYNNLGLLMRALFDHDKAVEYFLKAIEVNPEDGAAYSNLVGDLWSVIHRVYLKESPKGDWSPLALQKQAEAIALFRKVVERNPSVPQAHIEFARFLRDVLEGDEAIAALRRGLQRLPGETRLAEALAGHGWRAINPNPKYRDPKRTLEAIKAVQEAVEHAPQSLLAWQYLGWAQYRSGDWLASIEALKQSCKLHKSGRGDAGQWLLLALAHAQLATQENLPEKERAHHRAEASRWHEQAFKEIGNRTYRVGEVMWVFQEAIELDPKDAQAQYHFGLALDSNRNLQPAIAFYRKAIELDAKHVAARNKLVSALNALAWDLATHAEPARRDPARAVSLATEAIELRPQEGYYHNTLGAALYRAGDWKAAIVALEKSMELRKGGDSNDWFFLAMAHWQLGDKDKARQWYERAVEWTDKNQPMNAELRRFRVEAAELLELKEKK